MCRGYITSFSACKHTGRVVEQCCSNAVRRGSQHCEILVIKAETERRHRGCCADCIWRSQDAARILESQESHRVVGKGNAIVEMSLNAPLEGIMVQPTSSQNKIGDEAVAVETTSSSGVDCIIQQGERDAETEEELIIFSPCGEKLNLTQDPEAFYLSPPRSLGKGRTREAFISTSHARHENSEDDSCVCPEDEDKDGTARNSPLATNRETLDLSRWMLSLSVVDASGQDA